MLVKWEGPGAADPATRLSGVSIPVPEAPKRASLQLYNLLGTRVGEGKKSPPSDPGGVQTMQACVGPTGGGWFPESRARGPLHRVRWGACPLSRGTSPGHGASILLSLLIRVNTTEVIPKD